MAANLVKRKRVRSGHKGSATRTVRQVTELLGTDSPDRDRLALLRMTLKEKLDTIKSLDAEIVDLIEDEGELAEEIEQADTYKEGLYESILKVDRFLNTTPTPGTPHVPSSCLQRELLQLTPVSTESSCPSYSYAPSMVS